MTYQLPNKISVILKTMQKYYMKNHDIPSAKLLENAIPQVQEKYSYDNWNGGQAGHAITLSIPDSIFLEILDKKDEYKNKLLSDINKFHNFSGNNSGPNEWIEELFLVPSNISEDKNETSIKPESVSRIWKDGCLRAFISHRDIHKSEVSELSIILGRFGISAFVAHESIQPTQQWINEIENALHSMDVFIIYHKVGFHDSSYCDQEVGFAMARKTPIIVLWSDRDYPIKGFLTEIQAVKVFDKPIEAISSYVLSALFKSKAGDIFQKSFLNVFCSSPSYNITKDLLQEALRNNIKIDDLDIERLVNAYKTNPQISGYVGGNNKKFFEKIVAMHSGKKYSIKVNGGNSFKIEEKLPEDW